MLFQKSKEKAVVGSKSEPELYDSIRSTPMAVWNRIQEDGDMKALIKKGKATEAQLDQAWQKLYGEYIEEFGVSEIYEKHLIKKRELCYALLEDIEKSSAATRHNIKMKMKEVVNFFESQPKVNFGMIVSQLKKYMGQRIDMNTTMVYEFYNDYRLMREDFEAQKKQLEDNGRR